MLTRWYVDESWNPPIRPLPLQRDEVLKVRAQLEDASADRNRLKVYCPNTFGAELAALARHDFPADKVRRPPLHLPPPRTSSCGQLTP